MYHFIYQYAKGSSKYMKDHDKNKESWHRQYWDVNHLYGLEMSQKLLEITLSGSNKHLNLMKIS